MSERLDLPNGDWVDLTTRLNHAQQRRIRAAKPAGLDVMDEGTAALILNWSLRDVNEQPIPFPGAALHGIPAEALAAIPFDTFILIAERAAEISRAAAGELPKVGGKPRPSSPPVNGQPLTPSLPTSTSSPTTPDGTGPISSQPPPA